jgi:hypothetical protein
MTENELRALYTEAVQIIRAERRMREYVLRGKPEILEAKLAEMDRLLDIVTQIKDVAKAQVVAEHEQLALIPPPVKYE